jgi:hypothetical protein
MVPELEVMKPTTKDSPASEVNGRPVAELPAVIPDKPVANPVHELPGDEVPPRGR